MDDLILAALSHIEVSELSYKEWIKVGAALKYEGFPCSDWDDWSKNDDRYSPGECQKKWEGFNGSDNPATGATIIHMAQERGWDMLNDEANDLDWDDIIECKADDRHSPPVESKESPSADELITYLKTLYEPDDIVGYVTNDVYKDEKSGKWKPRKGIYCRTAGEIISELEKHPEDMGAAIGDWNPEAGAWIRPNALDGKGASDANVVKFKYVLVESDILSIEEQEDFYRSLKLPIAALVNSAGRSLQAIVKVDASNKPDYDKKVDYLYKFLKEKQFVTDDSDTNPSRLSRMPGITRNGKLQHLVATNIGCKNWDEWISYISGKSTDLPAIVYPSQMVDCPPSLAPELIEGILRLGHKMLITAASKAGKSFFMMQLGIAISEGLEFLGHSCMQGNVLYINLEIDGASCINRISSIYKAYGIENPRAGAFAVWNLRGYAMPLSQLLPEIIQRAEGKNYVAIMIDPIYKVITGDENSATDMGQFCNLFDRICEATGSSVIFSHHHSKGAQAGKSAQDRGSGSGVFARDPDAIIDLVELDLADDISEEDLDEYGARGFQMEFILREFKEPQNQKIWFRYPIHVLDDKNLLKNSYGRGDPKGNLKQNKDKTAKTQEEKDALMITAFNCICMGRDEVPAKELAEYFADSSDDIESKRTQLYKWAKKSKVIEITDGNVRLV